MNIIANARVLIRVHCLANCDSENQTKIRKTGNYNKFAMGLALWVEALTRIPRPTPQQWKTYPLLLRWLIITRAAVFIITLLSSGIAGILAYRDVLLHNIDHPDDKWEFSFSVI